MTCQCGLGFPSHVLEEISHHGEHAEPQYTIFPNVTRATALIDCIHQADVLTIEGKSYRRRQAEDRSQEGSISNKPPKPEKR